MNEKPTLQSVQKTHECKTTLQSVHGFKTDRSQYFSVQSLQS